MPDKEPISCGSCLAQIVTSQKKPDQIDWAKVGIERPLCVACKQALQENIQKIVITSDAKKVGVA